MTSAVAPSERKHGAGEEDRKAETVRTAARPLAPSGAVSKLLAMGFVEKDAVEALAKVGNHVEAAVDLLTDPGTSAEVPVSPSPEVVQSSAPAQMPKPADLGTAPVKVPVEVPPTSSQEVQRPAPTRTVRSPALPAPAASGRSAPSQPQLLTDSEEDSAEVVCVTGECAATYCDESSDSDVEIAFD